MTCCCVLVSSDVILICCPFLQRYQSLLDAWTPYTAGRWIGAGVLILVYMARVLILQGWYIVTYALGIYYLNLLIAFLTPKIDPVFEQMDEYGGEYLDVDFVLRDLPNFALHSFLQTTDPPFQRPPTMNLDRL